MSRYTRIELLVYVSFWLLITSFAVVSSWNLEQVSELHLDDEKSPLVILLSIKKHSSRIWTVNF